MKTKNGHFRIVFAWVGTYPGRGVQVFHFPKIWKVRRVRSECEVDARGATAPKRRRWSEGFEVMHHFGVGDVLTKCLEQHGRGSVGPASAALFEDGFDLRAPQHGKQWGGGA